MSKISDTQKKLRRWFRNHGWHTGNTPTGRGAWLGMPVQEGCNYVSWPYRKDGSLIPEEYQYHWHVDYLPTIEIDRFDPNIIVVSVYKRNVYTSGPGYEEKNKPWPNQPETYVKFTRDELRHLLELADACVEDWQAVCQVACKKRPVD